MIKGSCLCGKVKFEISGKPSSLSYCHCSRCRSAGKFLHYSDGFILFLHKAGHIITRRGCRCQNISVWHFTHLHQRPDHRAARARPAIGQHRFWQICQCLSRISHQLGRVRNRTHRDKSKAHFQVAGARLDIICSRLTGLFTVWSVTNYTAKSGVPNGLYIIRTYLRTN